MTQKSDITKHMMQGSSKTTHKYRYTTITNWYNIMGLYETLRIIDPTSTKVKLIWWPMK